jgi:arsenite oxidase small subunit
MERRKFIQIATAATCSAPLAIDASAKAPAARKYGRTKLVDVDGKPIKLAALKSNHNYVFNYPFEATPCFLLNLDQSINTPVGLKTEGGASYEWPGGVGPKKTLVAYSAICAHKLAYPSPQVSFIGFRVAPSAASARGKVITCCADKSVYDPYAGAKVMSGPAPQPLAAILLEYDAKTDEVFAVGTFGGEKFDEFFSKYAFKLSLEKGGSSAQSAVKTTTVLKDLAAHSQQTAQC